MSVRLGVAAARDLRNDLRRMSPRDRRLVLGVTAFAAVAAVLVVLGASHDDVLLMAPFLALVLPLLGGCFPGEQRLALLVERSRPKRAPSDTVVPARLRRPRMLPRGGRLLAMSLAVRPPPAPAL